jgi:hypothetical protein
MLHRKVGSAHEIVWRTQKAKKDDKSFPPIWRPLHQAITSGGLATTDAYLLMSEGLTAEQSKPTIIKRRARRTISKVNESRLQAKGALGPS